MKLVRSPKKMQTLTTTLKRRGKTIALVPTMGALHAGHLSLVKLARKMADIVVVSVFVNPLQFGPKEDYSKYPREIKKDLALLKKAGVDFVFLPRAAHMYANDFQTRVSVEKVSLGLCGASRPGHFVGVATVVLKLFNIVSPDFAVFGQKDFQQLVVIQTMVRDLNLPIKIIGAPIVREKDGLAMSSRNVYLAGAERQIAAGIFRGLKAVKRAVAKSGRPQGAAPTVLALKKIFLKELGRHKNVTLDYVKFVDSKSLLEIFKYSKAKTLVAVAVRVGKTRLIDNIRI